MKILKRITFLLSLVLLVPLIVFCTQSKNVSTAEAETTTNTDILKYISFAQKGKKIEMENIKTDGNKVYIVANGNISINLQPLSYNYTFDNAIDTTIFEPRNPQTITLEKNASGDFPNSFEYKGDTYYYRLSNNDLYLYTKDPGGTATLPIATITASTYSPISFSKTEDELKITIIDTYDYIFDPKNLDNTELTININSKKYTIVFYNAIVKFANNENPIVQFSCSGIDAGDTTYTDNVIRREQTYQHVNIDFLNNNYTEFNPLYFNINYNGFIYNFELYSKEIDSISYLFVNYFDTAKESNNTYLASKYQLDTEGNIVLDDNENPVLETKILKMKNASDFNIFSLVFNSTGRYEIEIYDSTYVYGLENANYYITSFYIKDEKTSAFENIYIIAQTYDDEDNYLNYIVKSSTLNYNVEATIKNLGNLGYDANGDKVNLEDIVEKIVISKITFGGSTNIEDITEYSIEQIKEKIQNKNELSLNFTEDAYYSIYVYRKSTENETDIIKRKNVIKYSFTVVKHAKTTFTVPILDDEGKEVLDQNGSPITETFEASKPYKTEIIDYKKNILSTMNLRIKFSTRLDLESNPDTELKKTFINTYTISYGMQQVAINKVVVEKSDDEKSKADSLDFEFYGVGTLLVRVLFNGQVTEYELNSELGNNTLSFTEYGTYQIYLVDSMGTEISGVYKLSKKLNTSGLILVILSGIIVAIVAVFILRARRNVATR